MHVADIDFIFLGHLETSVFQAPKVSLVVSQGYLKHILFYYSNKSTALCIYRQRKYMCCQVYGSHFMLSIYVDLCIGL